MRMFTIFVSLPARERGLKPSTGPGNRRCGKVAPRTGAWIETRQRFLSTYAPKVAPRTGAWIETAMRHPWKRLMQSLPARERGLKHPGQARDTRPSVAPRTGAWIETGKSAHTCTGTSSLPARERGLKQQRDRYCRSRIMSLPARERGLKHVHHA